MKDRAIVRIEQAKEFVAGVVDQLNKTCYLAIVQNDEGYDVEVEADRDTIAGTFATEYRSLAKARQIADAMEKELKSHGIKVISTRQAWERYI